MLLQEYNFNINLTCKDYLNVPSTIDSRFETTSTSTLTDAKGIDGHLTNFSSMKLLLRNRNSLFSAGDLYPTKVPSTERKDIISIHGFVVDGLQFSVSFS